MLAINRHIAPYHTVCYNLLPTYCAIALLLCSLPGSVVERDLHDSMSRMFPELLRFSSSSILLEMVPDELKNAYRPAATSNVPVTQTLQPRSQRIVHRMESTSSHTASAPSGAVDLWDGWGDKSDGGDSNLEFENGSNANSADESDGDMDVHGTSPTTSPHSK